jgi:hypothetical protein
MMGSLSDTRMSISRVCSSIPFHDLGRGWVDLI